MRAVLPIFVRAVKGTDEAVIAPVEFDLAEVSSVDAPLSVVVDNKKEAGETIRYRTYDDAWWVNWSSFKDAPLEWSDIKPVRAFVLGDHPLGSAAFRIQEDLTLRSPYSGSAPMRPSDDEIEACRHYRSVASRVAATIVVDGELFVKSEGPHVVFTNEDVVRTEGLAWNLSYRPFRHESSRIYAYGMNEIDVVRAMKGRDIAIDDGMMAGTQREKFKIVGPTPSTGFDFSSAAIHGAAWTALADQRMKPVQDYWPKGPSSRRRLDAYARMRESLERAYPNEPLPYRSNIAATWLGECDKADVLPAHDLAAALADYREVANVDIDPWMRTRIDMALRRFELSPPRAAPAIVPEDDIEALAFA